mmetsp:Transcript_9381/g.25114  ORF Transcript_9381/g.25114 Transcript_9381/m.25114 type:complete len:212 (+) Transcript_9381:155-790(+)
MFGHRETSAAPVKSWHKVVELTLDDDMVALAAFFALNMLCIFDAAITLASCSAFSSFSLNALVFFFSILLTFWTSFDLDITSSELQLSRLSMTSANSCLSPWCSASSTQISRSTCVVALWKSTSSCAPSFRSRARAYFIGIRVSCPPSGMSTWPGHRPSVCSSCKAANMKWMAPVLPCALIFMRWSGSYLSPHRDRQVSMMAPSSLILDSS